MKNVLLFAGLSILIIGLSSSNIDLANLFNYEAQTIPAYISKDNTTFNQISDEGATLGRVLFYDKNLSTNNTVSCSSCHMQQFAFSDTAVASQGVNGTTGRHSMRLINARFADEDRFFWDERAPSLEAQTTMPIQDHNEMGYSGENGDPDIMELISKLDQIDYYNDLFYLAFGDTIITEDRMQLALAQFVRSIQSFDSKFDEGRSQVPNDGAPFPNFTPQENMGKNLFLAPPVFNVNVRIGGGAGCAGCHRPPEFDIDQNSRNNGFIASINGGIDVTNTRSPSLRTVIKSNGELNGPLMHHGGPTNMATMIENHYGTINIAPQNDNIDPRLTPAGLGQILNLTNQEVTALVEFLKTLDGVDVYTNEKWSDPFDENGDLVLLNSPLSTATSEVDETPLTIFPNPVAEILTIEGDIENKEIRLYSMNGQLIQSLTPSSSIARIDVSTLKPGAYFVKRMNLEGKTASVHKVIKQ
jgi:cytochrome c peroxidase